MNENQKLVMLKIAKHLQHQVVDEHFNMYRWQDGTVGCAIGNSMHLLPGLTLQKGMGNIPHKANPECWGFNAIAKELGITHNRAIWLFSPCSYLNRTRKEVYTRIRAFANSEVVQ